MSSTIFFAHGNPLITESEMRHADRYRYQPDGRRNVVGNEDSSSGGLGSLLTASRLVKHFAVDGMDCSMTLCSGRAALASQCIC